MDSIKVDKYTVEVGQEDEKYVFRAWDMVNRGFQICLILKLII
jgi:hypothetical protein